MQIIWKEVGQTPLQALEQYRTEAHIAADVPMTYAGRLDPLAEGELLILIGDECKHKDAYLGLDKVYEIEVLFGVSTDTGDPMGCVQHVDTKCISLNQSVLNQYIGSHTWAYPAFSSKTVKGKPLFLWSLEGRISEIEIPVREINIYSLDLVGVRAVSTEELEGDIFNRIARITTEAVESKRLGADFRREAVMAGWREVFSEYVETQWQIATLHCACSSGTYMRTLAEKLGEQLSTPALALSIVRSEVVVP